MPAVFYMHLSQTSPVELAQRSTIEAILVKLRAESMTSCIVVVPKPGQVTLKGTNDRHIRGEGPTVGRLLANSSIKYIYPPLYMAMRAAPAPLASRAASHFN